MNELSLYILDIAQNSLKAKASKLQLNITEDIKNNILNITISDNGCGINKEILKKVTDPFYTTRTTRKVGLGLPLMKELCELCNGNFHIESVENKGTKVSCIFEYNNIDLPPLGDIEETIYTLFINDDNVEIDYNHIYINKQGEEKKFNLNSEKIKEILDGVSMKDFDVMHWIKDNIKDSINTIKC